MSTFQPPPTYALPVVVDEETGRSQFNPIWLRWFLDMARILSLLGAGGGAAQHNMLTGLQGGVDNQYYHLDATQYAALSQFNEAFPVGAIFVTIDPTNPAATLGYGTWQAFAPGRVLVGVDPSDSDFNPVEKTGGSKTQTFNV